MTKTRLEHELLAEGIRVAMIEHNGAPIELIEFEKNLKVK